MTEKRWAVPQSWAWASIGEIAEVVGGGTPDTKDAAANFSVAGIPWLTPADLTGYKDTYISRGARDLSEVGYKNSSAKLMPPGTVLFSSRAPIGYCVIASNEISTNQGFKSFILNGSLSPEYLRHYLIASVDYARSKSSGTTFQELSGSRAAELAVPIAPNSEQRRIVAKVDSLSATSKRARDQLDHIPRLVEKYKQAVLAATFNETEFARWEKGALEDFIIEGLIGLVRSKQQQSTSGGVPYIRMNHFDTEGIWNDDDLTFVDVSPAELLRYELRDGDVLFNTRNSVELVGKVAVWPAGRPGHVYNNNLLRLRFVSRVDPAFAGLLMISPAFRSYLQTVKSATTSVCAIYQRSIMAAPFACPSLDEQRSIAHHVHATLNHIDRLAGQAMSARKLIDHLDQAILAKAFRGALVPQDPNDEPASVLLERIRAERAAEPRQVRRGPKRSQKRTARH
jgi:type I restriction enzyme S subunit